MFCLCCSPEPYGFKAEGIAPPMLDIASAMRRRAGYDRRNGYSAAAAWHQERTDMVIRNVRAMTMDPHLGEMANTDIHIRDGEIVHLGRLTGSSANEIDGSGLTALPGSIADHRHLWAETIGAGVPAATADPRDIYCILRLALLDQLSTGVTCLHHCAIDIGATHAEPALLAQIDSGLRGLFSVPLPASSRVLREFQATWFCAPQEHLIELGLAAASDAVPDLPEFALLPVTGDHTAGDTASPPAAGPHAAATLGLEPWIGSLSPGKRADVILIRNAEPWQGRSGIPVSSGQIEMVCVDGRVRKRNGVLLEPNEGLIRREGAEAIARVTGASSIPSPAAIQHAG